MKKILALALALFAGTASAAISATKHNMNTYIGSGTADVCYFCHSAHNGATSTAPLWSRNSVTAGGWTFFTSQTISTNISAVDAFSGACLSCHDGTIAVNVTMKGKIGVAADKFLNAGNAYLSKNISNDHPVSISWAAAAVAGNESGLPATFPAANGFKLYGGTPSIVCESCHAVHGGTGTFTKFLRVDPASGSFCAGCHTTK